MGKPGRGLQHAWDREEVVVAIGSGDRREAQYKV